MRRWLAAGILLGLGVPLPAHGFSLFPGHPEGPTALVMAQAARWSSVTGLDDGLQVGIAPGVAEALQAPGDDLADVEQAIVDGIHAWHSPVLDFDVTLDAAAAAEGPDDGLEIDFFAVAGDHPLFLQNPQAFTGLSVPSISFFLDRPLTNGQQSSGYGITGADIYFNIDTWQLLAPLGAPRLEILTRVTIHELGHALGFGHPNEGTNYDTNTNPLDAMVIDPNDPFSDLIVSPFFDQEAIMSNEPCGPNPTSACPAVFFTSLGNDEFGGRDVLYPVVVPEPGSGALLLLGLFGVRAVRLRGARGWGRRSRA
jgi:hypothetical protein